MTSSDAKYTRQPRLFGSFRANRATEVLECGYPLADSERWRKGFDHIDAGVFGSPTPGTVQALLLDPVPALAAELVLPMLRLVTGTVAAFQRDCVKPARVVFVISVQVHRAWCEMGPLVAIPARSGWPMYEGAEIMANAALPEGLGSLSALGESPHIDHVSYYAVGTGDPLKERYLTVLTEPAGIEALYDTLRKDGWSVSEALETARAALGR